jgi:PIN domain nuclease of toxin-antitoxin system
VIILDAYALIAALVAEPAQVDVEPLLRDPAGAAIASVNFGECIDVLTRVRAIPSETVHERVGWLEAGGLFVVPVDRELATSAGEVRARRYHRRNRPLSMADCIALVLAQRESARLATADPHLAAAARDEGVVIIALPDSRGVRPAIAGTQEE